MPTTIKTQPIGGGLRSRVGGRWSGVEGRGSRVGLKVPCRDFDFFLGVVWRCE